MLSIPAVVRNKAIALGAPAWLEELPELLAEPEYDLGILMREDSIEFLAGDQQERSRRLEARSASWEWGVVERVSTGLLCTKVDLQSAGREMLTAADRVAPANGDPNFARG